MPGWWCVLGCALPGLLLSLAFPAPTQAEQCITDIFFEGDIPARVIFPNWTQVYMGGFGVLIAETTGSSPETLVGVTIVNFGSAQEGVDITAVYMRIYCVKAGADPDTGIVPMTFDGNYTEDSGTYPAWTWTGVSPDFAFCSEYCACAGFVRGFHFEIYADIASCPTPGATVNLGFPVNNLLNPGLPGSVYDNAALPDLGYNCAVPWGSDVHRGGNYDTIRWVNKTADREEAAPGDTINYTITYGMPGTAVISEVIVFDTRPDYTHYITGSGSPAEPAIDANRLQWTLPGADPIATGGATREMSFSLTVDWGNDPFDFGSGLFDQAAPENERLANQAQVFWSNAPAGCNTVVTPAAETVVRRFMFWKVADNDILFSSSLGQPPDEIIYEIFIRNISPTKTWWNVNVWDTVPATELDVWCPGCGLYDPCVGWTMTPSGCAAASPGKLLTGAKSDVTLLTWKLDLPPGATLTLRWKAQVKPGGGGKPPLSASPRWRRTGPTRWGGRVLRSAGRSSST